MNDVQRKDVKAVSDSYLQNLLANGEVVLIDTRQHWMAAIRYVLRPILILLLAAGLVLLNSWLGWDDGILGSLNDLILWIAGLLFIVSIIWLPIDLVRWWSRKYVLTSRRAMRMDGVLRKRSFDSSLEQINDIRTEQSFLGRTLGYADLTIYTASDAANEVYAQLLDGLQFKRAVLEAKEAIRAGTLLTELPEGFVVKGGTNEASMRADGKLKAPAEAAPAETPGATTAATVASVAAASTIIEPSGEVPAAAEFAPAVEPVTAAPVAPAVAPEPAAPVPVAPVAAEPAAPVAAEVAAPVEPEPAAPVAAEVAARPAPALVVEPVAEVAEVVPEPVAEVVAEPVEVVPEPVAEVVAEPVEVAPEPVAEAAHQAEDAAADVAHDAHEVVADTAQQGAEAAEGAFDAAADAASDVADATTDTAGEVADAASDMGDQVKPD